MLKEVRTVAAASLAGAAASGGESGLACAVFESKSWARSARGGGQTRVTGGERRRRGFGREVVLVGAWIPRRSDFALYRLLGAKRLALIIGLSTECTLLVFVPSIAGLAMGIAAWPESISGPVLEAVPLAGLQFIVAGCAALPVGVLVLLTKNPSGLIRNGR